MLKRLCAAGLFAIVFLSGLAADQDVLDYLVPVAADANLTVSGGFYTDVYWLETDGTEGLIVLRFQDERLAELPPCEEPFFEAYQLSLILNIPNVPDAGSNDGLVVLYGASEVGRAGRTNAGTEISVPLNPFLIPPASEIILVLKGAGADGLAIASKSSGKGPVLRAVSFPEGGGIGGYPMVEEEVEPIGRR